ncbi:MAG TPA: serine hydrolase domain-containing protein [Baekduia sp.]|uniref:serine hydrolase domain-containing protein n=1 Tax=Baekduia sp. TaxID=2600305 RepID=UPI002D78AC98|nr:serine hydrolase domain-containing protein [Baekduia sp.]HET6505315.1 serine hydrolase domain-containing protein [Baekduia sp.]
MTPTDAALRERLEEAMARHHVMAASVAVGRRGSIAVAAEGVLHARTRVRATPASLFQIGSITKPYTATVAMRLAEAGLIDLDRPMAEALPGFRVADAEATAVTTPRHLLTHTSGIGGDFFPDTGRGDDALTRYAELCADLGQDVPVGVIMSYSNAGYVILGRLIEHVTGSTWDAVLRRELLDPARLDDTCTLPEEALRHRVAWGHVAGADGELTPVGAWSLPRCLGPAGAVCATAADVVRFAQLHLADGRAADGRQVLDAASVTAMRTPQVRVPEPWSTGEHCGLGWFVSAPAGRRVFGHDGSTPGQNAYLVAVPEDGVAIAVLTNGGDGDGLARRLRDGLLAELCGIVMPSLPEPAPGAPPVPDDVLGRYERNGVRIDVERRSDGRVQMTTRLIEPLLSSLPPQAPVVCVLAPTASDGVFATEPEDGGTGWPVAFLEVGGARYLHDSARALRRIP